MKQSVIGMCSVAILFLTVGVSMAAEEAKFTVVTNCAPFEIRDYEPHILAETVVDGSFEEAGNKAFRRLFRYISGDNKASENVSMTSPVSQQPALEPSAQGSSEQHMVSFMMPAKYTMESIPQPDDPAIQLRLVPACRMASIRYSGTWSEKNYRESEAALKAWIKEQGLTVTGEPIWARYNPPFTPWFMRRNEILIPVAIE